jgi:hypothetical protein
VIAGVWVAVTASTAKTYHLAAPDIAAIPGVAGRARRGGQLPARAAAGAAALGLLAAGFGWAMLESLSILPSVTLLPGGVRLELAAGAVVGSALGPIGLGGLAALGLRGRRNPAARR